MTTRNVGSLVLLVLVLGLLCCAASAQIADRNPQPDDGAAAAGCLGCGAVMIISIVVVVAIDIAILVWVARDAKSRGMDSAVLWMLLVFFTHIIGLIIYLLARPQGNLMQCPHCGGKRLQASKTCPHCGNQ